MVWWEQSCKQLHSLADGPSSARGQQLVDNLRRFMAEAQHHDAVAGTEKQHVALDYAFRLHQGTIDCHKDIADSLQ